MISSSLMERSIYLFTKGSQQCFGKGRGHACVYSQDEIEAQLIQCVEQRYVDPDAADNPEKPEGDRLGLCF